MTYRLVISKHFILMDHKDYIFIPIFGMKAFFQLEEKNSFQGRQGKVHARVSIDLQKEFKKYIYFKTAL